MLRGVKPISINTVHGDLKAKDFPAVTIPSQNFNDL